MIRFICFAFCALSLFGCGGFIEGSGADESGSVEGSSALNATACPQSLILCVEGYHVKDLGNCRQVCVPDRGWECTSDAECSIYCITTPCPVGACVGHQCVIKEPHGGGGRPCGIRTCGAGEYCCNASCGICAPTGGFCTQQICTQPL